MSEKVKLQDITDEAIYLGVITLKEAEEIAKNLLKVNGYRTEEYKRCNSLVGKPKELHSYYFRHFANNKDCSWGNS